MIVTQLAERMILTPKDPGSNPGISPFYGKGVKDENKESPEIAIFKLLRLFVRGGIRTVIFKLRNEHTCH